MEPWKEDGFLSEQLPSSSTFSATDEDLEGCGKSGGNGSWDEDENDEINGRSPRMVKCEVESDADNNNKSSDWEEGGGSGFNGLLVDGIVKEEPETQNQSHFQCSVCNSNFLSKRDLLFHSQFHKPKRKVRRKLVKKGRKAESGKVSKAKTGDVAKNSRDGEGLVKDAVEGGRVTRSKRKTIGKRTGGSGRTSSKKKIGKEECTCSYCGVHCGCPSRLRDHMRKHTGERPFQCDTCGKKFVTLPVLRRHAKEHDEHKPHSCSICNKSFAAHSNLLGHMRLHDRKNAVLCSLCGKSYRNQTDLKIHERSHTGEKPFVCSFCGKSFVTRVVLKRHERAHAEHKPFSCPVCHKVFAAQVDVRGHMRSHPVKDLPLQCYICSHDCSTTEELSEHLETHSQKKKSLQCEICGRVSRNQSEFEIHLRRHTGEKPFTCHCGKSFVSNVILRKHMRRHSEEKPYQCEVCPKRFAAMADMKSHLRSHPAKKLQESILRFNMELLGQYRDQGSVPIQDLKLACSFCGKPSSSENSLRKHEKTHLGGQTDSCKTCGKIFPTSQAVHKHETECSQAAAVHTEHSDCPSDGL